MHSLDVAAVRPAMLSLSPPRPVSVCGARSNRLSLGVAVSSTCKCVIFHEEGEEVESSVKMLYLLGFFSSPS